MSHSDPEVTIARPSLGDLVALRRLFVAALASDFYYFAPRYIATISRQNSLLHLAAARSRRGRVMFVAISEVDVIGYVIGHVPRSRRGQLSWLYVQPSYRSTGVGKRLLLTSLEQLKRKGATSVTLATYNFQDYYRKHGFKEIRAENAHGLSMHIMEYDCG